LLRHGLGIYITDCLALPSNPTLYPLFLHEPYLCYSTFTAYTTILNSYQSLEVVIAYRYHQLAMDPNDTSVVFHTNSPGYLDKLIPERYREKRESTKSMCIFALKDRSHIHFEIKSQKQNIVIDVNVLEELSQIWHMVIPTLGGVPELKINLSLVPRAMLPTIENIIRNVGHMEYNELVGLPENARLLKDHLKLPTSTSRIIEYLQTIRTEEDGSEKGLWFPVERVNATIKFLAHLIEWTGTEAYYVHTKRQFERVAVEKNLERLTQDLKWFQEKQRKQEKKKPEELKSRRSSRLEKRKRTD
jgi:hypothetical protein